MTNLSGIYPPITTPFEANDQVALDQLEANLRRWIAEPLDGVVMPGSNSEAAHLTRSERTDILKVCADVRRGTDKHLIAGTGAETTAETIALTQEAAELGALAALILPPYFYKSALTPDVLIAHYKAVADASPIPLLVYNVPAFTGVDFAPATLLKMTEHERIIGAKDSSTNVVKIASVLASRTDFQILTGTGSALLPFLSLGAVGGVMALANFAAVPLRQVMDDFYTGRLNKARQTQLAVADLNHAITAKYGVAGLKYAMDGTGYYGGPARKPLLPLGAEGRAEIDRLLAALPFPLSSQNSSQEAHS